MKRECTAALAGGARGSIRAARPGDEPTVENFLIHLETRRSRGGAPKEDAEAAAEQALAAIRAVQQSDPEEADYHFILGEALRDLGRHSEAIAALRTAARMNERDAGYRCGLAEALWESSQYEKAARIFREALDRAPGDPQALSGLGAALLELHRDREALEPLREALRRDRRRWDALSNVGIARWRLGEKDEAVRAFRSAVRQQPSAAHARRNLGLALGALGRHSEALKVLRKARRDLPDEPAIRVDLADTLRALGRLAEALAVYRDTVDKHPGCLAERSGSREAFEELTVKELREELGTPSGFQRLLTALVTADVRGARAGSGAARRPARLGLALALLLLAGMIHVGWVLIPPHFRHFVFQDDVSAIAGAPLTDDADVLDRLMHAVRDRGLEGHVRGSQFEIATRPKWRNIQCHYEVPVRFLLYWTWTLSFEVSVERPYLLPKETIFI